MPRINRGEWSPQDLNDLSAAVDTRADIVNRARGIIAETLPILNATATSILIDGTVYYIIVGLKEGDIVSSMSVIIPTGGGGVALTLSKLGLYSVAGARLALSADQAASWETAGLKTATMGTPYQAPADMAAYAAAVSKGGTLPTFLRGASATQISGSIGSGARPMSSQVTQTDLPSPGVPAVGGLGFWISVNGIRAE